MKRFTTLQFTGIVLLFIFGIWVGAWLVAAAPIFKHISTQPLSDMFAAINALFAGFAFSGVVITVWFQNHELKDTKEELQRTARSAEDTAKANQASAQSNQRMVAHLDEQAILELFKTYCSEYFQVVKNASMSVLIPCVASKEYYEYVVSRFFVADQLEFPEQCWERVSRCTYYKSYEEFRKAEQNDRYKLDELINFFTLLTGRINSKDIIATCDFSYSWWRPLLWMIAMGQEQRYKENELVRTYGTPTYLMSVVKKLDEIYKLKPFANDRDAWEFITRHPKVRHYGLDPEFLELAAG